MIGDVFGGMYKRSLQLVVCVEVFLLVGTCTCVPVERVVGSISSLSVLSVSHSCSDWVAYWCLDGTICPDGLGLVSVAVSFPKAH